MEKLIGLTNVCLITVSLAIMIIGPADGSLSSGTEDHHRTDSWNQIESTSSVPFVTDDTKPAVRTPWLPAGRELLILEVPLSEPSGLNRDTDATGVLLMYEE